MALKSCVCEKCGTTVVIVVDPDPKVSEVKTDRPLMKAFGIDQRSCYCDTCGAVLYREVHALGKVNVIWDTSRPNPVVTPTEGAPVITTNPNTGTPRVQPYAAPTATD